jgi:hypothetical protein
MESLAIISTSLNIRPKEWLLWTYGFIEYDEEVELISWKIGIQGPFVCR